MSEWKETTLDDFVALQRGHDLTEEERTPANVPVMGSAGQNGFHSIPKAKGSGIVVGRSGASFGKVHYCEQDYWPHNTALYVTDFKGNHPRYAYYFLGTIDFSRYNSGSAQPSLNRNLIYSIPIAYPDLGEQQAIACILGALDDKIELNRRRNRTLEAMARAIFQSWFVDFDPVTRNANSANRHTSSRRRQSSGTAEPTHPTTGVVGSKYDTLFPGTFEDTELGDIPKGWRVGTVGELADIVGGSTPSTKEPDYWDGLHHWATPKDLSALDFPVLLGTERQVTDAGLSKISSGLLPIGTVLLSSRAPIGYLAINQVPVAINQGFVAMKPRKGVTPQFLLRWAATSHEEILSRANGSTFLEISKTNFRPIPLVIPEEKVHEAFDRLTSPLFEQVVTLERASRTLASLRDTLLPKLISEELRVPDAERIVGRVL